MPDQTTTAALAAQAQCRPNTVTKWARLHGIKPIGRDYLFSEQQVAAFLGRDRKPGRKPKDAAALSRSGDWRRKQKEKAMEATHRNLGKVLITESCLKLDELDAIGDERHVEHNGEIKKVTASLVSQKEKANDD